MFAQVLQSVLGKENEKDHQKPFLRTLRCTLLHAFLISRKNASSQNLRLQSMSSCCAPPYKMQNNNYDSDDKCYIFFPFKSLGPEFSFEDS